MKRKYIQITICFLFTSLAHSQFKIRQSFDSGETKAEPAEFSYTKPNDGKESYLVDLALGYDFNNSDTKSYTLFAEYHRNTLIDKEQNSFQTGFSYELFTNATFSLDATRKNSHRSIFNVTAKYNYNDIDTLHSAQLVADFTKFYNTHSWLGKIIPHNNITLCKEFAFQYSPSISLENEYVINAPIETNKGFIMRGVGNLFVGLYPLANTLNSKLELFFNIHERYDLINSISKEERNTKLIETGANFTILSNRKKSAILGASYNKGSNPLKGLKEQEYVIVALKVRL
jgi:hypothetical protein